VLILVRHGQTAANADGLLLGRADPPLNERGRAQAAALARGLPPLARVVSSPLLRARQTAAVLADANGVAVEVDDRWIELDYGTLDGVSAASVPDELWRRWAADPDHVPAGGESVAAVGARVRAACDDLVDEVATSDVAVVSHVSPIKAAISWALGVGVEIAWRMYLVDAAVCRIDTSGSVPVLLAVNDAGPLHVGTVQPA
jgi:broad specificity phosphatase PhoE